MIRFSINGIIDILAIKGVLHFDGIPCLLVNLIFCIEFQDAFRVKIFLIKPFLLSYNDSGYLPAISLQ